MRHKQNRYIFVAALATVFLTSLSAVTALAETNVPEETLSLQQLIELPEKDLAQVDIAAMNLACAVGLPGSEKLNIPSALARLDQWAL